jgi:hypothetical protein
MRREKTANLVADCVRRMDEYTRDLSTNLGVKMNNDED